MSSQPARIFHSRVTKENGSNGTREYALNSRCAPHVSDLFISMSSRRVQVRFRLPHQLVAFLGLPPGLLIPVHLAAAPGSAHKRREPPSLGQWDGDNKTPG